MLPGAALRLRPRGVLVDAAGVLITPTQPLADTYCAHAARHGVVGLTPELVSSRFRAAFAESAGAPAALRYVGDGAPFWRRMVARCCGSESDALFRSLFEHFAQPHAWAVAHNAAPALGRLRAAGVRLALVSNFDTRLRPLLAAHDGLDAAFDTLAISAEVGAEKPDARLFLAACAALGVPPGLCLHLGDDPEADVRGALAAGVAQAWLWPRDCASFDDLADRVCAAPPG